MITEPVHLSTPLLTFSIAFPVNAAAVETVRLFGELLSYKGDSVDPLQAAIRDWKSGALQPDQLNGRFLLVFFDDSAQETTVITDPLGSFHTYARCKGNRIEALNTDLLALAGNSRRLDWDAITT